MVLDIVMAILIIKEIDLIAVFLWGLIK